MVDFDQASAVAEVISQIGRQMFAEVFISFLLGIALLLLGINQLRQAVDLHAPPSDQRVIHKLVKAGVYLTLCGCAYAVALIIATR
jgi:protein-S-isoprenylcysteine O-methyltransferase Ste14